MRFSSQLLYFLLVGIIIPAPTLHAQDLKKKEQELSGIKAKIKETQKNVQKLKKKEGSILSILEGLDKNITSQRLRIKELRSSRNNLTKKIKSHSSDLKTTEASLSARQLEIQKRLRNLYKLGQLGYLRLLLSSDDSRTFRSVTHVTKKIITADLAMIDEFKQKKQKVSKLQSRLLEQNQHLNLLIREIDQKKESLAEKKARQKSLLRLVRNQTDFQKKAASELKDAAANLQKLLIRLKRSSKGRGFAKAKGILPYPVMGAIERGFGRERSKSMLKRQGIDFKAKNGDPIKAVFAGQVIYSGWFRGYGNIIIIDHGDDYYSLSAHTKELLKKVSSRVRQGDVIATVGESGSLKGAHLYFELRHRGKAIDPASWFLPLRK